MSAREIKMCSIQIKHKFSSMEEAQKVVSKLIEYIGYTSKKENYFCQEIIGVSNIKSRSVESIITEDIKERARPRLIHIPSASEKIEGNGKIIWHFLFKGGQ